MYLFFVYLLLTTLTNKQCKRRRKAILLSLWSPLNSVINLQEAPRTNFNTATQEYIHTRQLAKREKQRSREGIIAVARVRLLSSCFVMPYHHNNITAFYIHISIHVYRGMYMSCKPPNLFLFLSSFEGSTMFPCLWKLYCLFVLQLDKINFLSTLCPDRRRHTLLNFIPLSF